MTYKPDVSIGSDLHHMGILALKEKLRAMDRVNIIHNFDYELLQTEHYDLIENKTDKDEVLKIIYGNISLKSLTIHITIMESGFSNININVKLSKKDLDNWIENNDK